jgi:hypothetical protein
VVLWELPDTGEDRPRRALRLIGGAFLTLSAGYHSFDSAFLA